MHAKQLQCLRWLQEQSSELRNEKLKLDAEINLHFPEMAS